MEENVFFHGGDDRYFYIGEVDTKTRELKKILVYELGGTGFPNIISAHTGIFHDYVWVLFDGVYQELDEDGFVQFESRFERMEIVTEQKGEVYLGNQRSVEEMSRRELGEYIERFQRGGLKVRSWVVEHHMRLSLPMASFVFALFAAPLALMGRGGRAYGVIMSLAILLVYYVAVSVSRSWDQRGAAAPGVRLAGEQPILRERFGLSGLVRPLVLGLGDYNAFLDAPCACGRCPGHYAGCACAVCLQC